MLGKSSIPYVVERVNAGTEAPVQGEDLAVDKGGEGEIVEQVRERFPHVGIPILSETLVVEAVHLWKGEIFKSVFSRFFT